MNCSYQSPANGFQLNTAKGIVAIEEARASSTARLCGGFTLLELMIVVAVIAILLSIAVPSYDGFVTRAKLRSGTQALAAFRGVLEQSYQDSRSFRDEDDDTACGIATYASDNFTLTCAVASRTTYTLTATSLAGVGSGSAGDYVYTIDQDGVQATTKFKGTAVTEDYWKIK